MQRIRFDHNNTFDFMRSESSEANVLVFSDLKNFHRAEKSNGFAIRYVTQGVERYNFYGRDYPVARGQYLLSNASQEGFVEIDDKTRTVGICIGIETALITSVVATIVRPDTATADPSLGDFFTTSHFLENKYNAENTILGQYLEGLSAKSTRDPLSISANFPDFFFTVAEKLVADNVPIFKQLQAIPSVRTETRKDLYRRVERGKAFMDAAFTQQLTIDAIAKEACLSEYHFFRLFKSIFGISPHQYILNKRYALAHALLLNEQLSVSDVAMAVGFSDIFTFSKAFKKHFGFPPSQLFK